MTNSKYAPGTKVQVRIGNPAMYCDYLYKFLEGRDGEIVEYKPNASVINGPKLLVKFKGSCDHVNGTTEEGECCWHIDPIDVVCYASKDPV